MKFSIFQRNKKGQFSIKKGLALSERSESKGFSVFIAVIVMSALLLIAFSVTRLSMKEIEFSVFNRESQYAIFAADAGVECALYWDAKFIPSRFATSSSGSPINCGATVISSGAAISGTTTMSLIGGGGSANPTSAFGLSLSSPLNPTPACAIVTVTKNTNGTTHIASYGYNNCNTSDPRRVERGIEVTY